MIRAMLNMRCPKGHRHYSPNPDAFVGRMCFYPLLMDSKGRKCHEPLERIKGVK